jgi:SAM-dependent methyltransferase
MSAEDLDLPAGSFDAVIGVSVLHNLDIALVFAEMARVLKPDGFAVLLEPLGHNPVINAYRRRTPRSRDAFAHPLRFEDLSLARRWFARVDLSSFHVLAMLAGPVADRPGGRRLGRALHAIDRVLLDRVPGMRRYAWLAVLELGEPR